jgi:hypothetical protein
MKSIFKIVEYIQDKQIIVKFCKLHDVKLIDEYSAIAIDIDKLDTHDCDFFIDSLMTIGLNVIAEQEESIPVINDVETIDTNKILDLHSLINKNIKVNLKNYGVSSISYKLLPLKMRRIEL